MAYRTPTCSVGFAIRRFLSADLQSAQTFIFCSKANKERLIGLQILILKAVGLQIRRNESGIAVVCFIKNHDEVDDEIVFYSSPFYVRLAFSRTDKGNWLCG